MVVAKVKEVKVGKLQLLMRSTRVVIFFKTSTVELPRLKKLCEAQY
jgi:hypothetical protein